MELSKSRLSQYIQVSPSRFLGGIAHALQWVGGHMLPQPQEIAYDPATYCPFRIQSTTMPLPSGMLPVDIPAHGLCSASKTQEEDCRYARYSTPYCPTLRYQDFCKMPWATKDDI